MGRDRSRSPCAWMGPRERKGRSWWIRFRVCQALWYDCPGMRTTVLILSFVALLGGLWLVTAPPSPAAPLLAAPDALKLGVNADLTALSDSQLAALLARLHGDGLTVVRQRFAWEVLEPTRGVFDWTALDRVVEAATVHGLEIVAVLDGSPAWARRPADADNALAPPQERAEFGRFAAAVAQRYAGRVQFYQIWDEPNIAPHWGAQGVNPTDYAGFLREAAIQIKAVNPRAMIITAALAPTLEENAVNLSDVAFLDQLVSHGAAGGFDIVAAQPYGFDQPADAEPAADRLNYRRIELLRAVLERHGLDAVPLWATAAGWYAPPPGETDGAAPWPAVTPASQATFTADALAQARRWPWLTGWLWGGAVATAPPDPRRGFALWTATGQPRPAAAVLRQAAVPPESLGPGHHAPNAAALHYGPGWRVTALAADPGRNPDDTLQLRFDGQRLDLTVQRGPYWAYFQVTVDGQPANGLPRDESGNAYLVLYDPLAAPATVTVADQLAPGEHTVVIRPVGGWGQWPLLGIDVYDRTGGGTLAGQLAGVALIGVGSLGLVASAAWPPRPRRR